MSFRGRGRGRGRGGARFGGPRLPSTLLDEVDATYGSSRSNGPARRKAERKAARNPEPPAEQKGKRRSADEAEPPRKRAREALVEQAVAEPLKKKGKEPDRNARAEPKPKEKAKTEKNEKKELVLPELAGGHVEDREIEWLEYMLKKEKAKDEDSDGLDDLLDFADALGPGGRGLRKGEVSDGSDSELGSDLGDFLSDEDEDAERSDDDESGVEEGEEDGSEAEDADTSVTSDEQQVVVEEESEEWAGIASDDSDGEDVAAATGDVVQTAEVTAPAAGRYVPPHMRAAQLAEKAAGDSVKAAERVKLERKAQGLLNKLSEANIESILADTEKLFGEYSRNDVTTTLTALVIQMIGSKTNLLDSFVVLYATLVGAVHRVVGLEFGAHFVQTLVKKYSEMTSNLASDANMADTEDDSARETFNLLTLIAELYNAGVIGANLIYDLVRGFIKSKDGEIMSERSVEGLMKILKCCGSQLRSDDPSSLKDIVALVQEQTRGRDKDMTTRGRFMVETLVNLRSGKTKTKGLGAEREDVARMRRFLSGLGKKRRLLAPEPLRVGLADLLSADSRGKWWLVGAGWSGNPLVEHAAKGEVKKKKTAIAAEAEDEEVLLELARKQGMNTDVRRSVFVVLLSSEDYLHASDRLNAFKLTATQEREFVRVALHCCGMEEAYNPYYTLVLNNLCANSYDHRFTLQYALWDLLRELGDGVVPETRAANTAKSIAFLIARASIDLTILKAVEFTELGKPTRKFLDTLLRTLLIATQTVSPLLKLPKAFKVEEHMDVEVVEETFDKALSNPELAGGLAWVLQSIRKTPERGVGGRETEAIKIGAGAALQVLSKAVTA